MWFSVSVVLCVLFRSSRCYNGTKVFVQINFLTPISKDFQRLHSFTNDIAQFSKELVPFSKHFARSVMEKKEPFFPVLEITEAIRRRFVDTNIIKSIFSNTIAYFYTIYNNEHDKYERYYSMLSLIDILANGNATQKEIDTLSIECSSGVSSMILEYERRADIMYPEKKFSPGSASAIFDLIDSFRFVNYSLTNDQEMEFRRRFASIYFALEYFERTRDALNKFKMDKQGRLYENKLKLLEGLMRHFKLRPLRQDVLDSKSPSISLGAFLYNHFNRDVLLKMADFETAHILAMKYILYMCSEVRIKWISDPSFWLKDFELFDSRIDNLHTFIPGWFDSLLQSTWPTTETELIRGFMKEATSGAEIPEDSEEYSRIANVVRDRMKPIGHPSYHREYIITVEGDNQSFGFNCPENSCSVSVSMEAQCITLRVPRNRTEDTTIREKFSNFTTSIKPIFNAYMEKHYKDAIAQNVVNILSDEGIIHLDDFYNHSSFIALRKRRYWKHCSVSYALSKDNDVESPLTQTFRYHNDGGIFSMCNDWLFLLVV